MRQSTHQPLLHFPAVDIMLHELNGLSAFILMRRPPTCHQTRRRFVGSFEKSPSLFTTYTEALLGQKGVAASFLCSVSYFKVYDKFVAWVNVEHYCGTHWKLVKRMRVLCSPRHKFKWHKIRCQLPLPLVWSHNLTQKAADRDINGVYLTHKESQGASCLSYFQIPSSIQRVQVIFVESGALVRSGCLR